MKGSSCSSCRVEVQHLKPPKATFQIAVRTEIYSATYITQMLSCVCFMAVDFAPRPLHFISQGKNCVSHSAMEGNPHKGGDWWKEHCDMNVWGV